jgi:hypothetical protein
VDDGIYTVTLTITDQRGESGSATRDVTVDNVAPVADDQSVSTPHGVPIVITLSATDPAGENDPLTYAIASDPDFGSLSPLTGNTVTYTPPAGCILADSFTFTATDDDGGVSLPATVTITIIPVAEWVFDGLDDPYTPPEYAMTAGSSVPLTWRWLEAGVPVDSGGAAFELVIDQVDCSDRTVIIIPDIVEEDSGSSRLRYKNLEFQFNWQTKDSDGAPLPPGCYRANIVSGNLCQLESGGPFDFVLQ